MLEVMNVLNLGFKNKLSSTLKTHKAQGIYYKEKAQSTENIYFLLHIKMIVPSSHQKG